MAGIVLGLLGIVLGLSHIGLIIRAIRLEKQQKEQKSINIMIVKHLNQLLTDVDALIEESERE